MEHSSDFPDSFYRVSVKGLCVEDGKLLLSRESDGKWEIPGGGLDFGEEMHTALKREVAEEMGLEVRRISEKPVYVWTHKYGRNKRQMEWYYSFVVAYRVAFKDFNFTPTDECMEIGFFAPEELEALELKGQAIHLREIFRLEDFTEPF